MKFGVIFNQQRDNKSPGIGDIIRTKFPAHNKGWSPHPAAPSFTVLHASWAPEKYRRDSLLLHSCRMQQVHSEVGSVWGDSQVQGPRCAKNLKLRVRGTRSHNPSDCLQGTLKLLLDSLWVHVGV